MRRAVAGAAWLVCGAALLLSLLLLTRGDALLVKSLPIVAAGLALLAALIRASARLEGEQVARLIDRSHGLPDTMQAALQFSGNASDDRAGFVAALLREADQCAAHVSPVRAAPMRLRWPLICAAGALTLAVLSGLGSRTARDPAAAHARPAATAQRSQNQGQSATDPQAAYQRIARAVGRRELGTNAAVGALLEVERTLRSRARPSLDRALLGKLEKLFGPDEGSKRLRTLRSLAEELKQPDPPNDTAAQAALIAQKRRELDQLRTQHAQDAAAQRELAELEKRLSDAERAVRQQQPEAAAKQLDAARDQLGQQRQEQERDLEARATATQAEQLRELLQRRAGASAGRSQEQAERRAQNERRFGERAGDPAGQAQTSQGVTTQPAGEAGASGAGGGGTARESEAEPDLFARNQRPRVSLEDHAASSASGDGESRSEVILTAADRGFASAPYRRVYADYRNHAEELLQRDELPAAYRFYVRRYFQLIEPRNMGRAARAATGDEE